MRGTDETGPEQRRSQPPCSPDFAWGQGIAVYGLDRTRFGRKTSSCSRFWEPANTMNWCVVPAPGITSPSGHLLYSRAGALMAVPFDLASLKPNGSPVALAERALDIETASFTVSDSGTLAYLPVSPRRNERRLVWVDSKGIVDPLPVKTGAFFEPAISPDGRLRSRHHRRSSRNHLDTGIPTEHSHAIYIDVPGKQPGSRLDPRRKTIGVPRNSKWISKRFLEIRGRRQ